jgi:hypothetical protein
MFSAIRRRLRVSPATVIAGLALVFAMTGGAYAAKKYLITSTKQISPSVLKSLQGKAGPAGPAGAAGPAGLAGPQGPAGANGKDGSSGKNGENGKGGANGVSATSKSFTGKKTLGSEKCEEGGTEVTSASGTTLVCNGKAGQTGFTEALPSEKTETGAWTLPAKGALGSYSVPLSFTIPLENALSAAAVHFIAANGKEVVTLLPSEEFEEVVSTKCHGTAAAPQADPGNLCVYTAKLISAFLWTGQIKTVDAEAAAAGASRAGAQLVFVTPSTEAAGYGTWAVTAP